MVQIKHIESGVTYAAETNFAGYAIFDNIKPGAYEIKEITAPSGWLRDDATYTASVATGETTTFSLVNKELPGLRIIKYDRKNMVAMANVTFEIFRDSVSLGKFRTDEFGEILLTDAAPGTYRAVEVDTGSDGHILDTTPQEVELSAGDGHHQGGPDGDAGVPQRAERLAHHCKEGRCDRQGTERRDFYRHYFLRPVRCGR